MSEKNKERLEKVEEFCQKHYYTILVGTITTFTLVMGIASNKRSKKATETVCNDYRLYLMSKANEK